MSDLTTAEIAAFTAVVLLLVVTLVLLRRWSALNETGLSTRASGARTSMMHGIWEVVLWSGGCSGWRTDPRFIAALVFRPNSGTPSNAGD